MEKTFKNTWKQNAILFSGVFMTSLVIEAILNIQFISAIGYAINPMTGFRNILDVMAFFLFFVLPWRPVRRFVWNKAGSLVIRAKDWVPKAKDIKIKKRQKATNGQTINIHEDVDAFRKGVNVEKQHYTIKM